MMVNLLRGVGVMVAACWAIGCGGTVELHDDSASADSGSSSSSLVVQLAETSYEYLGCQGTAAVGGSEGMGPVLYAISRENANHPACGQWPEANPSLYLTVFFRGYLASTGFPTGEFDITDTEHVLVELSVGNQTELPVGQSERDYRTYRSEIAGSTGKVRSTFVRNLHDGRDSKLYRIDLANVLLGFSEDGSPGLSYPDRATVAQATLYYTDPF